MPELFDVVELLVTLPASNLRVGVRGAIVDCYAGGSYEVEFTDVIKDLIEYAIKSKDLNAI